MFKRIGLKLTAPPDADSVEKAFEQLQAEVTNLRKSLAENEKIIIKSIISDVEKTKIHPHSNLPGVCFQFNHASIYSKINENDLQVSVVCTELEGKDMNTIRTVAKQLLATHNATIVALLAREGADAATSFIIGASPDLAADLRPLLKEVFAKYPGKGGGDGRFVKHNMKYNTIIYMINRESGWMLLVLMLNCRFVQGSFAVDNKEVGPIVESIAEKLGAITLNAPSKK